MPKVAFSLKTLQSLLWIIRHNEVDTINLYNSITPFVQVALCGNSNMLNFGYWSQNKKALETDPLHAQRELSALVAKFGDFQSSHRVLDIGSGFSAPAIQWKSIYNFLDIICVNINSQQLSTAAKTLVPLIATNTTFNTIIDIDSGVISAADLKVRQSIATSVMCGDILSLVNATATTLPFADECVDRIIALESAQHFKPLQYFFKESARILKPKGLLLIAIPVIRGFPGSKINRGSFMQQLGKLGILYFSWASERYTLDNIKSLIRLEGLSIKDIQSIGHNVYEPLVDYYIRNRKFLKKTIRNSLSSHTQIISFKIIEYMIYRSALKMKSLSQKGIIDYVLIKGMKT
jgi:ubiquinone/menaquinone biosynthesis C-methylase UbiE